MSTGHGMMNDQFLSTNYEKNIKLFLHGYIRNCFEMYMYKNTVYV